MRGPWSKFAAFGGRGEPDNFRRCYLVGALVQVARHWTRISHTPTGVLVQVRSLSLAG